MAEQDLLNSQMQLCDDTGNVQEQGNWDNLECYRLQYLKAVYFLFKHLLLDKNQVSITH